MFFYFKFELVKPVSWKKICLKYFSLQKIDKNTPFVQKQPSEVFLKKKFSKLFSKLKGKHLCCSLFFDKNTGLRPATLIRKRLQQRCFAVNFVNFSRTPFLQNTSRWLLLFVIYLTVSFCKEILYICSNLLLEKSSKTHDFTIFSFCKYILYSIL